MKNLLELLKGADLRSIAQADQVAREIKTDQMKFDQVFEATFSSDATVRLRASDVIEKVTQKQPQLIQKHKSTLIDNLTYFHHQDTKAHIALILGYLETNHQEFQIIFNTLSVWACDKTESKIVRINALQALSELVERNDKKPSELRVLLSKVAEAEPTPLRARARKLLKKLK
ncbi:MAG: hypothetical protein HC880_21135 [Bacteroidia bacterium]|nr:hypothetical protein [Bacteroidia bacterium]